MGIVEEGGHLSWIMLLMGVGLNRSGDMGGVQCVEYHVGGGGAGISMTVSKANFIVLAMFCKCAVWCVEL